MIRPEKQSRPLEAGFTLVEVLVSLFIFAIISAGTMSAMFQTFAAKDRLDAASTELADIAAFRSIIRSDIAALDLRPGRDGLGGSERTLVTMDGEALLSFTRLGRSNPSGAERGQAERVRYLFREGQFIRESLLHENPARLEQWRGRVILEGLEDVDLAYISKPNSVLVRLETWTIPNVPSATQPDRNGAIEIRITDARGFETAHLFELVL